jgi:hypothetical protein
MWQRPKEQEMIKLIKSFCPTFFKKLAAGGKEIDRAGCSRHPVVVSILLILLSVSILPAVEKDLKEMSFAEASKKYQEITRVKSFLKTDAPREYPWSMNEFFDNSIYEKLVGNEFFGYYYDEGVNYDNPGNIIAIDTLAVIKGRGYEKYKSRYTRIFLQTLKQSEKYTYHVRKEARYSIGICIVSVKEKDDAESTKGIVLESYIKDRQKGKHFYHRFGTGSQGDLDQVMRLSAVRMLCNFEFLKARGAGSRGRRSAPSRRSPTSDRKVQQPTTACPFVSLKEETR